LIKKRIVNSSTSSPADLTKLEKLEELSLLLVRMTLQNADFLEYSQTTVVFSAIHAAATMLQLDQKKQTESQPPSSADK